MRVGGYVRLSRDEDQENYSSIISQKSIIEECALQNDWKVVRYYEDDNCSGYIFDRPGLNELIRDLESDRIDIVIAKDLSRIGRHNAYTLLFIDRMKHLGKQLVLPKEGGGYDTAKDESDMLGIKTWYNEMYVKDISRKIKSSIKAKQKEGRMIVKEYFGYTRSSYDKHRLEIDLEAAATVRLIFRLYLSGFGYRKIAEALNEAGYPTPSQHAKRRHQQLEAIYADNSSSSWTSSAVQRILSNDIYIGILRLGKTEKASIKGKSINKPQSQQFVFAENHPPIISREQFEEVQNILENRKKTGSKGAASKNNIFSGLLFCKDCGSYMIAYNKEGKARSYICGSYHRQGKSSCQRHTVKEEILESIVKDYLMSISKVLKEELREIQLEKHKESLDYNHGLLEDFKREHTILKEKYKILIMQKISDMQKENEKQFHNIVNRSYTELENELQNRLLHLERRISELEEDLEESLAKESVDALQILYKIINKPHLDKKDAAILIEKIVIDKEGNPEVFFKGSHSSICKRILEGTGAYWYVQIVAHLFH